MSNHAHQNKHDDLNKASKSISPDEFENLPDSGTSQPSLTPAQAISRTDWSPKHVLQLQRQYGNRFTDTFIKPSNKISVPKPSFTSSLLPKRLQRELATEAPEGVEEQDELSREQIRVALVYNNHRFTEEHIRTIQDIIGTEQTGRFEQDDIIAIGEIQNEYGLYRDGKIGPEMFQFLNDEMVNAGDTDISDGNALVSFAVYGPYPMQAGRTVAADGSRHIRIRGHFRIRAQFQERANPEEFEYRQFIQGNATLRRGSRTEDISHFWSHIPGGQLPASFVEDGNTNWSTVNYGHRDDDGNPQTTSTHGENHYTDADGTENQRSGSIYRGEDFPDVEIRNTRAGDILNIQINFRGEIWRNGSPIQTRRWTAINMQNFALS